MVSRKSVRLGSKMLGKGGLRRGQAKLHRPEGPRSLLSLRSEKAAADASGLRRHPQVRTQPYLKKIGMTRMATMLTTLIIGLMAGPLVSL